MSRQPSPSVRRKILSAARRIFGDKGYKEATIREIAKLAGVSVGGLYPYFGNKEQLYVEALEEGARMYKEGLLGLENEDPEVAVRRYIENHLEYTASRRQIVSRHFKDYDLEFVKPFRTQFFTYQKGLLGAIIRKGSEQRIFSVVNYGDAALFILCVLKGAIFNDLAGTIDLGKSGDALCRLVLRFLKQEKTTEDLTVVHQKKNRS
ncbi:MAG: HTH-type transcriptional repressor AcnR [Syntrophorhabdus sp. PtaU1.Bin058]|nr:MAG: HTH-type transcriptional repressor AcnR [Syntrophorhabdus sp. PtaU1.Bin058]